MVFIVVAPKHGPPDVLVHPASPNTRAATSLVVFVVVAPKHGPPDVLVHPASPNTRAATSLVVFVVVAPKHGPPDVLVRPASPNTRAATVLVVFVVVAPKHGPPDVLVRPASPNTRAVAGLVVFVVVAPKHDPPDVLVCPASPNTSASHLARPTRFPNTSATTPEVAALVLAGLASACPSECQPRLLGVDPGGMGMGERGVLRLAARQNGVVSRAQVLGEGVTARQIDRRREKRLWVSVFPGVYRIEGAPLTWLQQVNAAALWVGETGVLCHRTAAALWGLPRFAETGPIHVSHPTYLPPPEGVVSHQTGLGPREVVLHQGLRVTTLARTLLDLAATEAPGDVRAAVDFVLARKRLSLDEFRALVIRSKGRRGVRLLRSMLRAFEGGDGPTESELEARVMELIDAEGLPRPRKQSSLRVAGRWRRLDFFFPGTNVVIEADGFAWHANPISFEKDRERANALAARGLVVLHWTWQALGERRATLIDELQRALEQSRPRVA